MAFPTIFLYFSLSSLVNVPQICVVLCTSNGHNSFLKIKQALSVMVGKPLEAVPFCSHCLVLELLL